MMLFCAACVFKFLYPGYVSIDSSLAHVSQQDALYKALSTMDTQGLKVLIDQGIDLNESYDGQLQPLQYVLTHRIDHPRLYDVVKLLVEAKAHVVENNRQWTALHRAIRIQDIKIVELLLGSGAPVNECDSDGRTALHHACSIGFAQGVQKLLAYGADVSIKDKKNLRPLHIAAGKNRVSWSKQDDYPAIIEMLIEEGAHPDIPDKKGRTALHFAAMRGCDLVVASLLKYGACPKIMDCHRAQPIHYACGKIKVKYAHKDAYFAIANRLALSGSAIDRADKDGKTPLHYAASIGNDLIVSFLVDQGVPVNVMDNQGAMPMHYAFGKDSRRFMPLKYHEDFISTAQIREYAQAYDRVEDAHGKIIMKLFKHGAVCNSKDFGGHTPLTYAVRYNHHKLKHLVEQKIAQNR